MFGCLPRFGGHFARFLGPWCLGPFGHNYAQPSGKICHHFIAQDWSPLLNLSAVSVDLYLETWTPSPQAHLLSNVIGGFYSTMILGRRRIGLPPTLEVLMGHDSCALSRRHLVLEP
ncbi:hypothetical protein LZ32DRAFT_259305 [Colletotrichum eremochloae]|nr:hypothetical protein LZ32DRAFT_259305 [Colletotrichum eremochloae]